MMYEAGVAECYAYEPIGHDPLRQLIQELGLDGCADSTAARSFSNGALLRDDNDIGTRCGDGTLKAIRISTGRPSPCFRSRAGTAASCREDNAHPWARRTCEEILDQVADPIARQYLKVGAHSDMATEPHLTNGLIGLRNFLKSVPGYGAQYPIEGGMEMLRGGWPRA